MVDSAGVSNQQLTAQQRDPLGAALPGLGSVAATIHKLVEEGLAIDEAAQKVAGWVDPSLVPALKTLHTVLEAVLKFV